MATRDVGRGIARHLGRAGHQHARRADRDHGRLRLCARRPVKSQARAREMVAAEMVGNRTARMQTVQQKARLHGAGGRLDR